MHTKHYLFKEHYNGQRNSHDEFIYRSVFVYVKTGKSSNSRWIWKKQCSSWKSKPEDALSTTRKTTVSVYTQGFKSMIYSTSATCTHEAGGL